MARQSAKRPLTMLTIALAIGASVALPARAQPTSPQPPPAAGDTKSDAPQPMPPMSRECQPGAAEAGAETPLPNVAKAMRERGRIVILAIGASPLIRREGGAGGYYGLIENLLEQTYKGLRVEVVHRGLAGELARDAGARIKMEVGFAKPDLVLWQLGTADALSRLPVDDFAESVRQTLSWLKARNVDVALIGLQYVKAAIKDAHYQAVRAALRKAAAEQGVLRIGRYEAVELIARLKSEQGAPMSGARTTEAGYECSAEYLARAIASGLFLKTKPVKPSEPKK